MKQYLLLFFMLLLSISTLCAQDTWLRRYPYDEFPFAEDILLCSDGGYAVNGYFNMSNNRAFLMKTDTLGNRLWTVLDTLWNHETQSGAMIETDDGGILTLIGDSSTGANGALIKHDTNGDREWVQSLGTFLGTSMKMNPEGNLVLVGQNESGGNPAIRIVTQEGVTIQSSDLSVPGYPIPGYFTSVECDTDGSFVAVGGLWSYNPPYTITLVAKYDARGDTLWTRTYYTQYITDFARDADINSNGDIFVWSTGTMQNGIGSNILFKYDSSGETRMQRFYPGTYRGYGSVIVAPSGNLVYIQDSLILLKVDTFNGEPIWQSGYLFQGAAGVARGDEPFQLLSNNLIFAGAEENYDVFPYIFYVLIKKTDLQGQIVENVDQNQPVAVPLDIYPNPFGAQTTIKYKIQEKGAYQINIYNVKGQRVRSFNLSDRPIGTYQLEWNGTDTSQKKLSSGIYLIEFLCNDKSMGREKVTLIK